MSVIGLLAEYGQSHTGWDSPWSRNKVNCAVLDISGHKVSISSTPVMLHIPHKVKRTYTYVPNLGRDDLSTFGEVGTPDIDQDRVKAFLTAHEDLINLIPSGLPPQSTSLGYLMEAVVSALSSWTPSTKGSIKVQSIALSIGGKILLDHSTIKGWWSTTYADIISNQPKGENWTDYLKKPGTPIHTATCLVTGRPCVPARLWPAARVPTSEGGRRITTELPLSSWNEPAYEFAGLKQGDNFPVCSSVAMASKTGLELLLGEDPQRRWSRTARAVTLPSGSGHLIIWSDDGADDVADRIIEVLRLHPGKMSQDNQGSEESLEDRDVEEAPEAHSDLPDPWELLRESTIPAESSVILLEMYARNKRIQFTAPVRVDAAKAVDNLLRFKQVHMDPAFRGAIPAWLRSVSELASRSGRQTVRKGKVVHHINDQHMAAILKSAVTDGRISSSLGRVIEASYRPKRVSITPDIESYQIADEFQDRRIRQVLIHGPYSA